MEARRLVLLAILFLVMTAGCANAYNNVDAHPAINAAALAKFKADIMQNDQYLKNALLDGNCFGVAWDPADGGDRSITTDATRTKSVLRKKAIGQWIVDGGYAADEPEMPMGFRHFYDPEREPRYLTDQWTDYSLPILGNPKTSAYDWAFGAVNEYSFTRGLEYYKQALASTDQDNENYGKAWRSAGETMHLIADMTVPAHTRNDGHVSYDLYELCTKGYDAENVAGYYYSPAQLNYGEALDSLFIDVAEFTHDHFFSQDTLPRFSSGTTANGNDLYAKPAITLGSASDDGYHYIAVDGRQTPVASESVFAKYGIFRQPKLRLDATVIDAQQTKLLSTAIRSGAAVLDAFLPRFTVMVDGVEPVSGSPGTYNVRGHITHHATSVWPDDLTIGNGATVCVGDLTYPIEAGSSGSLNDLAVHVLAKPGDRVTVEYNLGGYRIISQPFEIKADAEPLKHMLTRYANGQVCVDAYYLDNGAYPRQWVGVYHQYYDNGQLQNEINYQAGVMQGLSRSWYDNGQLQSEINYVNGKLEGEVKTWYDNGQHASLQTYVNDKLEGDGISWYRNGVKWWVTPYVHGKKEGTAFEYHDNGMLKSTTEYHNDLKNGWLRSYTMDGKLFAEGYYVNDYSSSPPPP